MAEHDPSTAEHSDAAEADEVTGFGLIGGLIGDGSVLPSPAQLPGVASDLKITKVHDASTAVIFQKYGTGEHIQ